MNCHLLKTRVIKCFASSSDVIRHYEHESIQRAVNKQCRRNLTQCRSTSLNFHISLMSHSSSENTYTVTMSRPVLSTHVLDISTGRPAAGMFVELYKKKDNGWTLWHNTVTSSDGRIQFPFSKESMAEGTYKLKFNVEDHYTRSNQETLYPYVEIVFKTKEDEHYHIPLLLSPYGYSTYRGS